jgi:hypothetical protein
LAFFCPSPYFLPAILRFSPEILTSTGLDLLNMPISVLPYIGILGTKLGSSICSWFNGPWTGILGEVTSNCSAGYPVKAGISVLSIS